MAEKQTFETVLEKHENLDATGITIPFDVEKLFGAKRVPVKARINDAEYRGSIVSMGGKFMMAVPKVFREAAGVRAGEKITVTVEKDTAQRTVKVPADLAEALEKAGLTESFSKLSYTNQKEAVRAVEEAKRAETRLSRIKKAVETSRLKK